MYEYFSCKPLARERRRLFFFALISTLEREKRGKKGLFANYTLQKGIITYMI